MLPALQPEWTIGNHSTGEIEAPGDLVLQEGGRRPVTRISFGYEVARRMPTFAYRELV